MTSNILNMGIMISIVTLIARRQIKKNHFGSLSTISDRRGIDQEKTVPNLQTGYVFTNHSQEHSLSFPPIFANWNVTPYGLANQNLCYIPMLLRMGKSGELDKECSKKWLVNTDPGLDCTFKSHIFSSLQNI